MKAIGKTVFSEVSSVGSDTITINVGAGIGTSGSGGEDEDQTMIKLSDISEGDLVTVTLDENGRTVTIKVMGVTDMGNHN